MNDAFVGDIGDYIKFALLRTLQNGRKVGVVWCLTQPLKQGSTKHGHHTDYLHRADPWERIDPELFNALKRLVKGRSSLRTVAHLQAAELLPKAAYAADEIPIGHKARDEWLAKTEAAIRRADLLRIT